MLLQIKESINMKAVDLVVVICLDWMTIMSLMPPFREMKQDFLTIHAM